MSSQSWPNIAQVLYQSTPLQFDQLVRLHQKDFPIPGLCPPTVQLVVFGDVNAIPELLQSRSTNHEDHPGRGVDVRTASHVNSGPSGVTVSGHTSAADGSDSLGDGDRRAEGLAEYDAQDADHADDGEEPDRTEEAKVIQRAARGHLLKDTEAHSNDALTKGRHRLFKSCKASAKTVHAKYRKIYLGPVPHLLLCVEWIVTRAQDSKNAIKARRADATLQEKSDLIVQHKQMR
jgi:hypothetical protein